MKGGESAQSISGFAPAGQQAIEFVWGEQAAIAGVTLAAVALNISRDLSRRKVYIYIWGSATAQDDNYIKAYIRFFKNQSKVGELPVFIGASNGGSTRVTSSLPCLVASGGNPIADSLGVNLSAPTGTQPASVLLQPNLVNVSADIVQLDVTEIFNNATVRAFLAIRSSY